MLSETQERIVALARQGLDLNGIARNLRTKPHLVSANITRITAKGEWPEGLSLPWVLAQGNVPHGITPPAGHESAVKAERPTMAPAEGYQPKVNIREMSTAEIRQLQDRIERTGEVPAELLEAINRGTNDVNPLIIMGCTIQFIKLCGGRVAAHQVIEDVYDSLRAFADGAGIRHVG